MNIRETIDDIFAVAKKEGLKEGMVKGVNETNERVAKDMLKKNLPLPLIAEISRLSEASIRNLAKNLGVSVV